MRHLVSVDEERAFAIEELFFSRTDHKGLILGGNSVFTRISGFDAAELVNAPHNIIRHPDMPKAVFKLLWDHLLSDKSIVVYVKNRAKDGKFYWVLAYASPITGGFLSVRLKPSSDIFKLIAPLYEKMRKIEMEKNVQASTDFLLAELAKLGFNSYLDFAREILCVEMESRDALLDSKGSQVKDLGAESREGHQGEVHRSAANAKRLYQRVKKISSFVKSFAEESKTVISQCSRLNFLAINLAAESERIGEGGRTLNVVSSQFNSWGRTVQDAAVGFKGPAETLLEAASQMRFQLAVAAFQYEVLAQFLSERNLDSKDHSNAENELLLASKALELARDSRRICEDFEKIRARVAGQLSQLSSSVLALEIVRLSGKIEASQIGTEAKDIGTQINEMNNFLGNLKGPFKKMNAVSQSLETDAAAVLSELSSLISSTNSFQSTRSA